VVVGTAEPVNTDPPRLSCVFTALPLIPKVERLTMCTVSDEIGSVRGVGSVRA
jgi:hypothetical protein